MTSQPGKTSQSQERHTPGHETQGMSQSDWAEYAKRLQAERDALRAQQKELVEALEDIRAELEQANGGKGPSLPLSARILGIARTALAKHGR